MHENDPVAAFDQMGATLVGFAEPLAAFYRALCEQGLSQEEAMYLVNSCMSILLSQPWRERE